MICRRSTIRRMDRAPTPRHALEPLEQRSLLNGSAAQLEVSYEGTVITNGQAVPVHLSEVRLRSGASWRFDVTNRGASTVTFARDYQIPRQPSVFLKSEYYQPLPRSAFFMPEYLTTLTRSLAPGESGSFVVQFYVGDDSTGQFATSVTLDVAHTLTDFTFPISTSVVHAPDPEIRPVITLPNQTSTFQDAVILGRSASAWFSIHNAGTGSLALDPTAGAITRIEGEHASDFRIVRRPAAIGNEFRVRFSPSGVGERRAILRVQTTSVQEPVTELLITGVGTGLAIETAGWSDRPRNRGVVSFRSVPIGEVWTATVTLHNVTNEPIRLLGLHPARIAHPEPGSGYPLSFRIVRQPAAVIPPGGTTSLTIRCAPRTEDYPSALLILKTGDEGVRVYKGIVRGAVN